MIRFAPLLVRVALAGALIASTVSLTPAQGVLPSQQTIAQQLLSSNPANRNLALAQARRIEPKEVGPELRGALIALLDQMNALVNQLRDRQIPTDTVEAPETIVSVQEAVAALRDPAAIPALADSLGTNVAVEALAQFGEQAAPTVLSVVLDPTRHYNAVEDGLRVLRFMVERQEDYPLSEETLDAIRQSARMRLTGEQYFTVLWYAIDLAAALHDPEFRQTLEGLANFQEDVQARGVIDPRQVELTQKRAAAGLRGSQALPRPRY